MKIIEPYHKIEDDLDGFTLLQKIERAART